jgi:hypothetical protein
MSARSTGGLMAPSRTGEAELRLRFTFRVVKRAVQDQSLVRDAD